MGEDREDVGSCLRMENLGQSCIELRIPHTKRTDRRTDGRWSLEGAQKNADKDLWEFRSRAMDSGCQIFPFTRLAAIWNFAR